jgi:hypothetical protein
MSVAVGAGSRGITNHDVIVRTVCEELKRLGAEVFIVPAMGSHGRATAAGQMDVLAHYGITESAIGVPVKSSMKVVELGRTGEFVVYQDRQAAGADAIVPVNRIKPHTDFHGPIESGLMKMAAIGLGKQKGAYQFHQATVRLGHAPALLPIAREVLRLSKLPFGVGILENPLHQTARVVAVPAASMEQDEMKLLKEARRLMPKAALSCPGPAPSNGFMSAACTWTATAMPPASAWPTSFTTACWRRWTGRPRRSTLSPR